MSGADRQVLEFAGALGVITAGQAGQLLGEDASDAQERLASLAAARLLARDRSGCEDPGWFRITRAGLARIAGRLGPPAFDPRMRHAVGVGWLWLSARAGSLGTVEGVLCERQMRAEDQDGGPAAPLGVQAGLFGGFGVHFPDLLLLVEGGRVPVELLVAAPASRRVAPVLRAYAADARVRGVLYLVEDVRVGLLVQAVAARLELTPLVGCQRVRLPGS